VNFYHQNMALGPANTTQMVVQAIKVLSLEQEDVVTSLVAAHRLQALVSTTSTVFQTRVAVSGPTTRTTNLIALKV